MPSTDTADAPVAVEELSLETPATETAEAPEPSPETLAAPDAETSEAEAPAKQSFDDLIEADEEYKAHFEERIKQREDEAYFKAQEEIAKRAPELQEMTRAFNRAQGELAKAQNEIPALTAAIQDAVASGDADLLNQAFRKHPSAWNAIQMIAETNISNRVAQERAKWETEDLSFRTAEASWSAAQTIVDTGAKVAGSADLARTFTARLEADRKAGGDGVETIKEYINSLIDLGYKRGLKEGGHATAETAKAEARSGKGPDTAEKGAVATNSKLTLEAAMNAPIDEIRRIRERQKKGS